MEDIKRIYLFKFILVILVCFISFYVKAQTTSSAVDNNRHFVFYGGVGPNYYFNNLVKAKDKVNEFNYSFVGRVMWEPEHLLSIGIESGYYRLYTLNVTQPTKVHIANSAIPIQLVVSMKFLKTFYGNFAIGRSILLNKVDSQDYGNFDASLLSLADISLTVGHKRRLNDKISLGAETKFYYSSKANDKNLALLFVCGYRFH